MESNATMSRPVAFSGVITFMVSVPPQEQSKLNEIYEEYAVETDENIPGGCIIWGRSRLSWHPNVSGRWLVSYLLKSR